jgi:penicillin-binding protein 2
MFGTDEVSDKLIRRKLIFCMAIIIIGFVILIIRLGYLQILCTQYYVERSENNRILPVRLIPPRGVLYDRQGKEPVADNETAFDLCIAPTKAEHLNDPDERRFKALQLLGIDADQILNKLNESQSAAFEPVVIKEDVCKEIAAYMAENNSHMQEIVIRSRPKRRYKKLAAHIIGYTAPVDEDDLENGYELNDVIGKTGIEAQYEDHLKGELGWKMVEVNAYGHVVRDLPVPIKAEPGRSLNLTLDISLQKKAEELLEGKAGAVIAVNPRNGEILAIVSKPDFDPNIFSGGCSKEDWDELVNNLDRPLMNRAIAGEYPPGSTFKIVTATAALAEGKIDYSTSFHCNGRFNLGRWTFKCHKPGGHGWMNIHTGLAESCNVFFYNVAYQRGVNVSMLHKYAAMYGLGQKTGIDISGEKKGYIPRMDKYPGDKINMCIGQGALLVTPIQMVNLISVVANRGFSYKPHLVSDLEVYKPEILTDIRDKVPQSALEIIRNGLASVVERGYSRQANLPDYHTAGKTGSAQNPHGDTHAWFIGYAPVQHPEIAVAVIVENAGRGSENAAPIAGQIFATYFYGDQPMLAERQ